MQKPGFIWKMYGLYFAVLTVQHFFDLLAPQSPVYLFYHILIGFHRPLFIVYLSNILGALLSLLSLWPLYLFIFHKRRFHPALWQILFLLKILGDLLGNYYQFLTLKSFYFTDRTLAFQIFAGNILTALPSYIACFQYAFRQDKIFPDRNY